MKVVYILMADGDRTMRSIPEPFGVAVTSEEEAKQFVERDKNYNAYQKLTIFDTVEEALDHAFPKRHIWAAEAAAFKERQKRGEV